MDAWKLGIWGWALLSAPAAAQEVYRCTQGREVAYQAKPCGQGGTQARWRIIEHPPPPPPRTQAVAARPKAAKGRAPHACASDCAEAAGGWCGDRRG